MICLKDLIVEQVDVYRYIEYFERYKMLAFRMADGCECKCYWDRFVETQAREVLETMNPIGGVNHHSVVLNAVINVIAFVNGFCSIENSKL
jgi:hypothetical protein